MGMAAPFRPEQVFTPRRAEVNTEMSVPRPRLEAAISSGIRSKLHLVIKGESGCGKSWLYKKVFAEQNVYFRTVNLAFALSCGSVAEAAVRTISRRACAQTSGLEAYRWLRRQLVTPTH
jgi:hypothetical protein